MIKSRYYEFDLLKGIGIILVYLGHAFYFPNLYITGGIYYYIQSTIYSFHMPLFFFASGFFSNSLGKKIDYKKFYKNKFERLFIPYLFINFLDYIPRKVFPNLVNSDTEGVKELLFYGTKISWFVYTLFILFLIFPLLNEGILKREKYFLFGLFLLFINIKGYGNNIEIFSINKVVSYGIYFYFGYKLREYYSSNLVNKVFNSKVFLLLIGIIIIKFAYKTFYLSIINTIFFGMIGTIFVLVILRKVDESCKFLKYIEFIGKNSLTFYLIEGFIAVVYRTLLIRIIPIDERAILLISFFLLKVITGYLVIKYIITKNSILSFLLGARKE